MYLEHFGLNVNPFGLSPKLDFLYRSSAFEESMAHLIYGLDNSEAIILITGAIGTGKTMALQSFLSHLGPQFAFALVTNTRVNSVELLKLILDDLGVSFPAGADKSDLLILFKNFLLDSSRAGRRVLLVVDEAQNLSRDVLEEIRLLTNLGQGEGQPVQIVLLGQPELEDILDRKDLAQLKQRIRVHYRLAFLTRSELQEYLDHRMEVAGCDREVFSRAAVDKIFEMSRGVPRVVNTVAGEALLSAFVADHKVVQPGDVDTDPGQPAIPESRDLPPRPVSAGPSPEPVVLPELRRQREEQAGQPVMAVRASSGWGRRRAAWVIAVLVVVALVTGYQLGYLGTPRATVASRKPLGPQQADTPEEIAAGSAQPTPVVAEPIPVSPETVSAPIQATYLPAVGTSSTEANVEGTGAVASAGDFFVHVSSFRSQDRASNMVARFSATGIASQEHRQVVKGSVWFRVFVGPFADREEALAAAVELKDSGRISYYRIVRLDSVAGS